MLMFSLIIPVYNEERHIRACLDAIACQSDMPDEVIVVDNNCSDETITIAKQYDFVQIVHEKNQGRGHARNAGFNAARGDILARIDADSKLAKDWVARVKKHFKKDKNLHGLTGLGITPIIPLLKNPKSTYLTRCYYWNVHTFFRTVTMWGATMAISREAWENVQEAVCLDDTLVHEDQDISLCMAGLSLKIIQANDVRVVSTNQSFRYLPKMLYYTGLRNKTKKRHIMLGNLPPHDQVCIPLRNLIGSYTLSLGAFVYGLVGGFILFPLDWFMVNVVKKKGWFN